ncbi:uncharacterized protein EV422DRAFT_185427 [Fimicolochytrium jonesii]|uniref:uncharacterized protein n=1 Tax=Fimicolochytrium jonesii TaxID=1396493 RepID=UPI0022FEE899|nr:uncharacterized protein EV422DRAFT_185427 [Fimicolochytrium jonesii]KAI8818403.1 hypothetical protein EV422DRAFT_185427 [Fimicolochytrium jonesii]
MSGNAQRGVYESSAGDTNFRRKWDREELAKRAAEREKSSGKGQKGNERGRRGGNADDDDEDDEPVERGLLQAREGPIDLTSNLNKTQIVQASGAQQPGFYCKVCDCTVKDSVNYLDHINGWKHQKNMGMSMNVERSTVDQVKARLEALKRKAAVPELDFDARIEKAKEEEEEAKRAKKREKKEKKKKQKSSASEEPVDPDADMMALMGFGGFGTSKK